MSVLLFELFRFGTGVACAPPVCTPRRHGWIVLPIFCALAIVTAVFVPPAQAGHLIVINEVLASWQGDDSVQFVELEVTGQDQRAVGGARLEFYDQDGNRIEFIVLTDVTNGSDATRILVATARVAQLADLSPDFTIMTKDPPVIRPQGGRICYRAPAGSDVGAALVDCVAWGNYNGPNEDTVDRLL